MPSTRLLSFLLGSALIPASLVAQERLPPAPVAVWPADAFADAGADDLVLHALALRDSAAAGLRSYEATATERTHVGMSITRRLPLRARTLYHREQLARIYWDRSGRHRVRWIGRRESTPAMGDEWSQRAPFGLDFDIVDELDLDDIGIDLLFDPLGDRLDVFEAEFVQPVSSAGLALYRFASGDTMRILLPAPARTITLVEVIVRPRQPAWEAVEGSLWFDRETGVLARAAFRPSDVWNWEVRERGSLDDVPGFLKPAIGTVQSIVVEYGLFEQRWWLPRRVVGEGIFDWGHGLVRMPLTVEWTMAGHVVNEAPGPAVTAGADVVSAGRGFFGDDGRRERVDYLAPAGVDLSRSPELPPPLIAGGQDAFPRAELDAMVARVEQVAGPPPGPPPPALSDALLASFRYDRVRGPNAGHRWTIAAGAVQVAPHLRLALAVPDLFGGVEIARAAGVVSLYRELADASDWNVADGLGNTAATLLFGDDGGDYYRVTGAALGVRGDAVPARWRVAAFAERHRPIARQTSVSLATLGGGSLRTNLTAARIDLVGARGEVAGQVGADVAATVLNWRLRGEAATGDARYGRIAGSVRVTGPLGRGAAGAIELAAGVAGDGTPPQRHFLLGGARTLRGVRENAIAGPAFWLVRAEAGLGLAGMRAVTFADIGWAGARVALRESGATGGAGIGASFMDGLFRIDLARGIARSGVWRVYFQLDALL